MNAGIKNVFIRLAAIVMGLAVILPATAAEATSRWHQESASYAVYLGVVPAELLRAAPTLVDGDRTLHGGLQSLKPGTQHVMVSVFERATGKRVTDAKIAARVKRGLLDGSTERPLERMLTSDTVTYGNFFPMLELGNYKIEVEIGGPNGEAVQTVTFKYKRG